MLQNHGNIKEILEEEVKELTEKEKSEAQDGNDEEEDEDSILDAVKNYQSRQENHSCMMPKNMESEVLCGMPFQIANDITVRGKRNEIWIGDHIKFNYQP